MNSSTLRPWSVIAARRVYRAFGARFSSAASNVISPLRTDVSTFTSAMPGRARRADEVDVAAQAAPLHLALHPLGRVGVVEHEHDVLERHGDDQQAEHVLAARPADRGQVHFAAGKLHFARLLAVDVDGRAGIEVLQPTARCGGRPTPRAR